MKSSHFVVSLFVVLAVLASASRTSIASDKVQATVRATPLEGDGAEIQVFGSCIKERFKPGSTLFTNRNYVVKECPDWLMERRYVISSIDHVGFACTKEGVITVLTPDPAHPRACSHFERLEKAGFVRIGEPQTFQLFGEQPFDLVRIYQKKLKQGEAYRWGKWAVVVGHSKASSFHEPTQPWSENDGELLYNGIRLPKSWPPRTLDSSSFEPMPVPYLDHPPKVIPIDVGRQLFVDDFLIESTDMTRRFHKARKYEGNPVLKPETELELNGQHNAIACPKSGGVWWDPQLQRFRMWYEAGWIHTICYATSPDGLQWNRPNLDIQPGTNRILDPAITPDSWAVFPDYGAQDPEQRWKIYLRPPGGMIPGLCMVSGDGIHWSQPIESGITGDRSTMFYNPFRKKWVYSLRSGVRGRSRHYWEHEDFLAGAKWEDFTYTHGPKTPVFWAGADRLDPPDPQIGQKAQLYNLDAVAYESIMLGIYQIHLGPPNNECMKTGLPKTTELNLAYSRDGFHWDRPDRSPFIPATRQDTWDRGYVQSVGGLCLIRGDKLWFYYIGFQGNAKRLSPHWLENGMYDRGSTGVAFLRRDGFASLDAADQPRTLTTRPVRFSGKHLFVNLAADKGALRAEVLDEHNKPIEPFTLANCVSLRADSTLEPVRWTGADDLSSLTGRPVRFRFELESGSLYAFWVSRDATGRSDGYVAAGGPGFNGPTDTVGRSPRKSCSRLGERADAEQSR